MSWVLDLGLGICFFLSALLPKPQPTAEITMVMSREMAAFGGCLLGSVSRKEEWVSTRDPKFVIVTPSNIVVSVVFSFPFY